MEKQLEDRIYKLGRKITKSEHTVGTHPYCPNGAGHTSGDIVEYGGEKIVGYRYYNSSRKERKKARSELMEILENSSDEEVRNLVLDRFENTKKIDNEAFKFRTKKAIKIGVGIGIAYLIFRGCQLLHEYWDYQIPFFKK